MDRKDARRYIRENAKLLLEPDRSRRGYVCPICGSGTGKNGTGITTKDGVYFTCWAGCFTSADIIDIIGLRDGISGYREKLIRCAELLGVSIGDMPYKERRNSGSRGSGVSERNVPDYEDLFRHAAESLEKTTYHRGISLPTLRRFGAGYVEKWRHPKAPEGVPYSPRLIIPTSGRSYLARDTRRPEDMEPSERNYVKSKVGETQILNVGALDTSDKPVFIVEGEIDALSVIDAGGEAIATGGTSGVRKLLVLLRENKPNRGLIVMMDGDEAGDKASRTLIEGLAELGLPFARISIPPPYKDANEMLVSDRDALIRLAGSAERILADAANEKACEVRRESAINYLDSFLSDICDKGGKLRYPTGFGKLDNILDGGLYPGLYVVGSVTSLGKTTLCLQIADQIAKAGVDALIFSMEMSRSELIAKSLSRITAEKCLAGGGDMSGAMTLRAIMSGRRQDIARSAAKEYSRYAGRVYITEGVGDVTALGIRESVERHASATGSLPVVVIDYLQILSPIDPRMTDKQSVDRSVLELKRLSRDLSIPIVGISSFNRENYVSPVNLSSFKESGAIEYSSDVLIGLQYDGMDYRDGEKESDRFRRVRELEKSMIEAAKGGNPQRVQVKVLKSRNGRRGSAVLEFYPAFSCFTGASGGWRPSESRYE